MSEIIGVFDGVLTRGKELGASDVHLCVGTPWRYRLYGEIIPISTLSVLTAAETEAIVHHIVTLSRNVPEGEIDSFVHLLKDFDCSYSLQGVSRFRVNICRQRGTFSVVLRLIPFEMPTIKKLRLPPVIEQITMEERGLILVTGITGSGKSTTLAAMLNLINNSKPAKIVTIEDPIEFLHNEVKSSVIQREVGSDTESFDKALRATLRQDPDVIMVGEMRDRNTIDTALKAAETGHLVLSTLHTLDAPKTIQRIVSVFELNEQKVLRIRLAETIRAVVSQRLVPRSDRQGLVAVFEIMRNTLAIQECIRDAEKIDSVRDLIAAGYSQYGMQTFDQHLMKLYKNGIVDMETAMAAATSSTDFEHNADFTQ